MKRLFLLLFVVLAIGPLVDAQTVFTYGPHPVSVQAFLRAYQRNNTDSAKPTEKSLRNYLDLFINAKLKVREAYTRRYDTLPGITLEVENLRTQLIDKYLADPVLLEKLKQESALRARTDREVAHLFIAFKPDGSTPDSGRANRRKQEISDRLRQGQSFDQLVRSYSDDPAVSQNSGRLGFVTAFTLPYDMETAIYNTTVGGVSSWVRSENGYHLFRVMSERSAVGTIRARHILLAIPPNANSDQKKQIEQLVDSLYRLLNNGASISELARLYSNDNISAANGGEMPEFRVGQYAPEFEERVVALRKDGDLSRPFLTAHGWHIIQRIAFTPLPVDLRDLDADRTFDQLVRSDVRWRNSKNFIYELVQQKAGYRRSTYDETALCQFADSLLDLKPMTLHGKAIQYNSVLFSIGRDLSKKTYTAGDWVRYATNFRSKPDGSGFKPMAQVRNEWEQYLLVEYYKLNLESFNDEYRDQLTEFRDGNLFFEIMQQEVWNKAQVDTSAQRALYNKQSSKYNWKASADVALFFCSDIDAANELHAKIQARPSNWRNESLSFGERVFYDSARMEWEQIPNLGAQVPTAGMLLDPVVNQTDNNATLALVLQVYPKSGPKTFEEARGSVISDLQVEIEKKWKTALRKKYPVKIDEKVFSSLLK